MDYFANIIGQYQAVNLLQSSINSGNISHAYLFLGPSGVGKVLAARAFAATLLSTYDSEAAVYFKDEVHPDLLVIDKLEGKNLIGKEQISRDMEPWLALKPYRAAHRVVIIKNSHLLSLEAANALLKTLEEPPDYAVIILVADEDNLLETILSRCQMVRFIPVPEKEIERFLIDHGYDKEKACRASRLGQGSISTALRFIEEAEFEKIWNLAREVIIGFSGGQVVEVYNSAEKMEKEPELITNLMETILRDIYIYQETGDENLLTIPDNMEFIKKAKLLNKDIIGESIDTISTLKKYYRRNVNSLIININIAFAIWQVFK